MGMSHDDELGVGKESLGERTGQVGCSLPVGEYAIDRQGTQQEVEDCRVGRLVLLHGPFGARRSPNRVESILDRLADSSM